MKEWRLYAWGANSHGQLGLGFKSEQSLLPTEVDISSSGLNIRRIKKIIGGAGHTLILDEKGELFSCGSNNKGQAGFPSDEVKFVAKFERIEALRHERVEDIECGWNSSMALTEDGEIYAWGSNSHGQLGIDEAAVNADRWQPGKIRTEEKVIAFSVGLRHSAIVSEGGRVSTSGSGSKGQLGRSDVNGRGIRGSRIFGEIASLKDVVGVTCGENHSAALTKSGQIYTWGDNRYGQLGIDNSTNKGIDRPTIVEMGNNGNFSELRAGWSHTNAISDEGTIVAWGRNTYGQLGFRNEENGSEDEKNSWVAKSICGYPKFCRFSTGSEHNVAIAEDGSVYCWGWNEHGNCGTGSTRDVPEPRKVQFPRDGEALVVGSGAGHSFAIIANET